MAYPGLSLQSVRRERLAQEGTRLSGENVRPPHRPAPSCRRYESRGNTLAVWIQRKAEAGGFPPHETRCPFASFPCEFQQIASCLLQTDKIRHLNTSVLLFDRPFVNSQTNKRVCLFQHLSKIIPTGKYRCRCIQSRPSHCFQADSGSLRAASRRLHASRTNLNPINKYMLFYGRFSSQLCKHVSSVLAPLITLWRFANPVLFVGKTRTGRHSPEASGFFFPPF